MPYSEITIKAVIDEKLATGTIEDNTPVRNRKTMFEKLSEDQKTLIRKTVWHNFQFIFISLKLESHCYFFMENSTVTQFFYYDNYLCSALFLYFQE